MNRSKQIIVALFGVLGRKHVVEIRVEIMKRSSENALFFYSFFLCLLK